MSSLSDRDVNGQTSPAFEQLLAALPACSGEEKRILLDRLLRDLIGDKPEREFGLYNPDGSSYLFLVPTKIHLERSLTSERRAELEERSSNPGKMIPFREVIARLEAMEQTTPQE